MLAPCQWRTGFCHWSKWESINLIFEVYDYNLCSAVRNTLSISVIPCWSSFGFFSAQNRNLNLFISLRVSTRSWMVEGPSWRSSEGTRSMRILLLLLCLSYSDYLFQNIKRKRWHKVESILVHPFLGDDPCRLCIPHQRWIHNLIRIAKIYQWDYNLIE